MEQNSEACNSNSNDFSTNNDNVERVDNNILPTTSKNVRRIQKTNTYHNNQSSSRQCRNEYFPSRSNDFSNRNVDISERRSFQGSRNYRGASNGFHNGWNFSRNYDFRKHQIDRDDRRDHRFNNKGFNKFNNHNFKKGVKKSSSLVDDVPNTSESSLNLKEESSEMEHLNQRDSMIFQFANNQYDCVICVSNIRADTPIWTCDNCYHAFHIGCIKTWAKKLIGVPTDGQVIILRCPTCQKPHDFTRFRTPRKSFTSSDFIVLPYKCWCRKQTNPVPRRGSNVPHSCDGVCGKPLADSVKSETYTNRDRCRHTCGLLCHPGPCPPCESMVSRNCHCGQSQLITKCSADERTVVCGQTCKLVLSCGVHYCQEICHAGDCAPCRTMIDQECFCDRKNTRSIMCGLLTGEMARAAQQKLSFSCGEDCDRVLDCGNHRCTYMCHDGDCAKCQWTPELINRCWCNKKSQEELGNKRLSCLDPVKGCGAPCDRKFELCGHLCGVECHQGDCDPCPMTKDMYCLCGKSIIPEVPCTSLENEAAAPMCKSICRKKLLCGRHTCDDRCCVDEVHWCPRQCGRLLSCEQHRCKRECGHVGQCPVCDNVSFEELRCHCGLEVILPPIACGVPKPNCTRLCTRDHPCDHPVRHNCHSDATCPPCTELMRKPCPGDHVMMDNIPCFRSVVTCGRPCGRPLEGCEHLCVRNCHQGECLKNDDVCSQWCQKPRSDCGHPCGAPCHPNIDCQMVMKICITQVVLFCSCKTKTVSITCSKLDNIVALIKSKSSSDGKRDAMDIILSPSDGNVSLPCDNDCKKLARNLKLAEAFDVSVTISNLNTHYSDSLKTYAKSNIDFLLYVEKTLLEFTKNTTELAFKKLINNLTNEKADFISRYSACFKMNCKCLHDKVKGTSVVIEVNRSHCCLPKPLLSELLKAEYPYLFPMKIDSDKQMAPSSNALAMSFADKIRLAKKE